MSKNQQVQAFVSGEGDHWFTRNRTFLEATPLIPSIPIAMIAEVISEGESILEIGCSNGANLLALSSLRRVQCFGIDPSSQAVEAGQCAAPELNLTKGTSDHLPYPSEKFNVAWFGFCLYLLDRSLLMTTIAEADRVLCEGGFLVITDFDAPSARIRPYHHREGIFSYKMDYSALFLANPAYALVAKKSYSHASSYFDPDPDERIATWLLRKSGSTAYHPQG